MVSPSPKELFQPEIIQRINSVLSKCPVLQYLQLLLSMIAALFGDVYELYGCPSSKRTARLQMKKRLLK